MSRDRQRRKPPTPKRTHWPEQRPSDCYDWLTPDQVVRLALGSYYMLCRKFDRLPADPTQERGEFNNGRACFSEDLAQIFALKLDEHGFKQGAKGFEDYASERLKLFFSWPVDTPGDTPGRDIHCAQSHNENGR